MLHITLRENYAMVQGDLKARTVLYRNLNALGFDVESYNDVVLVWCEGLQSLSENHITVKNYQGVKMTFRRTSFQKVLSAMEKHHLTGYIHYKGMRQRVIHGQKQRACLFQEHYHQEDNWFPPTPRLEGWVQIIYQ